MDRVGGNRSCTDLVLMPLPEGPQCSFAHRMQHTEDRKSTVDIDSSPCDSYSWHVDIEIAELVQLLGLPESVTPAAPSQAPPPEQKESQGEGSTPGAGTKE